MGVVMGVVNYPGQPLAVQEDNQGFCFIFRAGNSRCRLCWTIAKAIEDVSKGAGVRVAIVKVGRVTGDGEIVADALSKGEFEKAFGVMKLKEKAERMPRALLKWVENPRVTARLGMEILENLRVKIPILPMELC
jgi:hypothetical protein